MSQRPSSSAGAKPWEHAKSGAGSASDPLATRFVESLSYDQRLYRQDIAGSLAHAAMLCQQQLISSDDLAAIEAGLTQIRQEIDQHGPAWPGWKIELEDVHMCIEADLIAKIGDPGRKLHTGRSRNDQVALDLKLWIHDACCALEGQYRELLAAFLDLAQRQGQIVMPSYTHLQRAQPIVLGGELLAWVAALDRARQRVTVLTELNSANPLGSGAIAGSSLPLDRGAAADLLPLGRPTDNSIDGTASRDAALDFVYALAMTTMTLSRWAEQWIIYSSTEFGFVQLDDRYTTGSSMMPQKKNPDMLELIRGRCGNVYGHLVALLTLCKGLPLGYNRDLQEDKRQVFAAYDIVFDSLAMASRIVRTARFDGPRIAAGLERGFLDATSLAEYLVVQKVPFRTAHQVVGRLVALCQSRGLGRLAELSVAQMNQVCAEAAGGLEPVTPAVEQWLGAAQVVQRYQSAGNAGVNGFQQQLELWQERMKSL